MFTWEIMSWLFKVPVAIMKKIMFWLFKDWTVTVALLNFDHAQSNGKKWSKKIELPHFNFFLQELIKFSCTYQPLSLCKISKSLYNGSRAKRMHSFCPFWTQHSPFAQMRIFSENSLISLALLIHTYLHAKNQSQILIFQWKIYD